ncbi:hypothetical protein [Mycobacterium sp.]|uniref:hypothetical protein n=1 Tax=Mycobacterium sp. TaxID=1785 RepID=UPI003F94D3C8
MSENRCEKVHHALLGPTVRIGTAAAIAVVAVVGRVPVAAAESDHDVPIVFHYHGQPSVPIAQQCEKLNGVDGFAVGNPTVAGSTPGDTWPAPQASAVSCA